MKRRLALGASLLGVAGAAAVAAAATPGPSGATPAPFGSAPPPPVLSAAPALSAAIGATCHEQVPEGKERPKLTEKIPSRGQSGHALTLSLVLEHGKGETVLPSGLQTQADAPGFRELAQVGLYLPDPDGGAGPVLERTEKGERASTRLELSFVPLPQKPGRNVIVIPPLPISVARASGDVLVLCTSPHEVTIEDPIANTSNPKPKPNPPPREQREEWTALKNALTIGAAALVVGALVALLVTRWLKRPRPVPPPPPPRPPWEVALEELFDVRHAGLVAEGRLAEHFDRVSDTVRKYLGARYGFDGLESTTREALSVLRAVTPAIEPLDSIESFLRQADLVKFAKTTPAAEDGELALVRAEHIVRQTLPNAVREAEPAPAPIAPLPPPPPTAAEDEATKWGPKPPPTEREP